MGEPTFMRIATMTISTRKADTTDTMMSQIGIDIFFLSIELVVLWNIVSTSLSSDLP